jgi:23S rRNA (cytosine1962-C5)-methyltransferase
MLEQRLTLAIDARLPLLEPKHESAVRLFNGFTEGFPALAIDLYARTVVLHDYAPSAQGDEAMARSALAVVQAKLPWVNAALWKVRHSKDVEPRNGSMLLGEEKGLARKVRENGVWYALALRMNRDTSLYLDTRNLRAWAKETLAGKKVLNTFAYTGSLGVAARAAGATVMHTDAKKPFLTVAKDSYSMNGWPVKKAEFWPGDYFDVCGALKRESALFDCVFVDPPFLSVTEQGRVDLENELKNVLNKVRPLVGHGGQLVVVNNAVFASGESFMKTLEELSADGYMAFERRIDVPEDFTGTEKTRAGALPVSPAPFNHSTKIAVLAVKRKDGRTASDPKPAKPPKPVKAPKDETQLPTDEPDDE